MQDPLDAPEQENKSPTWEMLKRVFLFIAQLFVFFIMVIILMFMMLALFEAFSSIL